MFAALPPDTRDLIRVEDVSVSYSSAGQIVRAVDHASFSISEREVVGILGESGSGKTTLALSLAGALPSRARLDSGRIFFRGQNLLAMTEKQFTAVRGAQIAVIWQDPALALNPVMRIGQQISEVLRAHGQKDRRERVRTWLREVGFENPEEVAGAYPHQLSGGQRQRVVIAQAVCCQPALVIADEPTSKLDAALQMEILQLLARLRDQHHMAFLIISHDPAVLAGWTDRMLVMYAGAIMEEGATEEIVNRPLHPYTEALVRLFRASGQFTRQRLPVIAGEAPDQAQLPPGCVFQARCPERMGLCAERRPAWSTVANGRQVGCFKYE